MLGAFTVAVKSTDPAIPAKFALFVDNWVKLVCKSTEPKVIAGDVILFVNIGYL